MYAKPKTDPLSLDPDNDGLTTGQEYALGGDPFQFDTDGDGISDTMEAKHNTNARIEEAGVERQKRSEPAFLATLRRGCTAKDARERRPRQAEGKISDKDAQATSLLNNQPPAPCPLPSASINQPDEAREQYYQQASQVLGWENYDDLSWNTLEKDINGQFDLGWTMDRLVYERAIAQGESPSNAAYLLAQSPFLQHHKNKGLIGPQQIGEYTQEMVAEVENRQTKTVDKTVQPVELDDERELSLED